MGAETAGNVLRVDQMGRDRGADDFATTRPGDHVCWGFGIEWPKLRVAAVQTRQVLMGRSD